MKDKKRSVFRLLQTHFTDEPLEPVVILYDGSKPFSPESENSNFKKKKDFFFCGVTT